MNSDSSNSKPYLTWQEAMEFLGCKRSTLYQMVNNRDIPTHKFKYDKRRYFARADVERMKQLREQPWLAGEETKEEILHEEAVA